MNNCLLSVDNISREFITKNDRIEVLKNTSLSVHKNETIAIRGSSGSGKSTLLYALGGLDKPNKGSIYFKETMIYEASRSWQCKYRHSNIGFIFQSYHLLSELNILENVALPSISILGHKKANILAQELIESVGLVDRINHRPQELSGGEKQRVAIARSLINNPDVILADEPTGNLDEKTAEKVLNYLFHLIERRGHSLVLVTHSEKVAKYCQRQLLLKEGVLKEV